MPEKHAVLSPSSAYRWLNCTPSARLAEQFPDKPSKDAVAGTLAHSIAELKARKHFLETEMSTRSYNSRMKKYKADPAYEANMDSATDTYLEYLKTLSMSFSSPPFVALEMQVNVGHLVPGGFGRADCIMIGEGRLCVIDYKNGAGVPVEAEDNPQMMLYALGALHDFSPIYGESIQQVQMSIVQPNAGGVKEWIIPKDNLIQWGEEYVRPRAELADKGEGEYNPGAWCKKGFCPARAQCTAYAEKMLGLEPLKGAKPEGLPLSAKPDIQSARPLLTDAEIGDILARAEDLESWVKSLKDYALSAMLEGKSIPGWKLVEGKSSRDWINQDEAFKTLQERGIAEALLWERKAITVAGLEKSMGKATFKEAADGLWVKKPGKPAPVRETDKRPPYNPAAIAFKPVNP